MTRKSFMGLMATTCVAALLSFTVPVGADTTASCCKKKNNCSECCAEKCCGKDCCKDGCCKDRQKDKGCK